MTRNLRNKFEQQVFKQLRHDERGTKLKEARYESEVFQYVISATYTPDFVLEMKDGTKLYIESKGWLMPEDRKKLLLIKNQYPSVDLRLVFQQDNKISRKGMRYSEWANRHGFKWAIGVVPKEWFS